MPKEPGKVITFYSYKGGTGRSMALANIACLLAQKYNNKVLMLDWDLEAPGLHRYFRNQFKTLTTDINLLDQELDNRIGVIDLFEDLNQKIDYLQAGTDEEEVYSFLNEFDFEPFILETDISNLHLIKAGRFDNDYSAKINSFPWMNFYQRVPSLVPLLVQVLQEKYHYQYILIDSRTGVTDTSGICTMLMPDTLVVVFTPNRQSLLGVLSVAEKSIAYRQQSSDLRPLTVFPLPSRIETSETKLRESWRLGGQESNQLGYQSEFEKIFAKAYELPDVSLQTYFDEVQVQHLPRYAYGEEIAILTEQLGDRLSITRSYQRFTERLVSLDVPWEDEPTASKLPQPVQAIDNVEKISPYKGLTSFKEQDVRFFYGRESFINRLKDWLNRERFLAIVSPSASGKSSVIQAGLIPQLKVNPNWRCYFMVPGKSPFTSLRDAFANPNEDQGTVQGFLAKGANGLKTQIEALGAERVFLFIDQLEEIFTLCEVEQERAKFFSYLFEVLEITPCLRLIVAMQSEFFTRCIAKEYAGLQQKIEGNLFTVLPMTDDELREAIIKPAEVVNVSFEPELVTQIIEDMKGSSNNLSSLEYTLAKLFENRTGNILLLKHYSALGGIRGCLEEQANQVYDSLSDQEQEVAKHIFLALTQVGEGTDVTRCRVLKRDLITPAFSEELIEEVLQHLSKSGLISLSSISLRADQKKGKNNHSDAKISDVTVEVVHEALIRQWSKIKQWVDESRENFRKLSKLEFIAKEWREHGKSPAYLLRGTVLQEAQQFYKEKGNEFHLSNIASDLIQVSSKKQTSDRRTKILISIIGLILLVLLPGFLYNKLKLKYYEFSIRTCTSPIKCSSKYKEILENLVANGVSLDKLNLSSTTESKQRFDLSGGGFVNAKFNRSNFSNTLFNQALLFGTEFSNAILSGAEFNQAYLAWAFLVNADLSGANFTNANLQSATMFKANLQGANLQSADLTRAVLDRAQFQGANLNETILIRTHGFTNEMIKSTCNWEKATFESNLTANLNKIHQLKQDTNSNPTKPPTCSQFK